MKTVLYRASFLNGSFVPDDENPHLCKTNLRRTTPVWFYLKFYLQTVAFICCGFHFSFLKKYDNGKT